MTRVLVPRLKFKFPFPEEVFLILKRTCATVVGVCQSYTPNLLAEVEVAELICTSDPVPNEVPGLLSTTLPPADPVLKR